MNLGTARKRFYGASETVSNLTRQLSFSGIGLVLALRLGQTGKQFPRDLAYGALFIIAALSADFLQYVVTTLIWGVFQHRSEDRIKRERETDEGIEDAAPVRWDTWFNTVPLVFFVIKIGLMFVAYAFLLKFLVGYLF